MLPVSFLEVGYWYWWQSWRGIADKFTKLSEVGFSLKSFKVGYLEFSSAAVQIFCLGDRLWACRHFQAFQEFFQNFNSLVVNRDILSMIAKRSKIAQK